MATVAIKGHPTRGREVIQLLVMLGGVNKHQIDAIRETYVYFVDIDGIIRLLQIDQLLPEQYIVYSLEELEEKFPYKVDDIVVNHKYGKGDITQMLWIDNEIVYEIHFEDYMAYCKANELCKYDAFKGLLLQELTEYLSHATREELDKTMEEIEIALAPFKVGDKVIVKGYEKMGEDEVICVFKTYDGDIKYKTKNHLDTHYFMEDSLTRVEKSNKEENMEKRLEPVYELGTGKILYYEEKVSGEKYCPIGETTLYTQEGYEFRDETNNVINAKKITLARKQPQYPKTYMECCEVLRLPSQNILVYDNFECGNYDYFLNLLTSLNQFTSLKICRDAYWKVYGEQMGLGKPWEPDYDSGVNKYGIICMNGVVHKSNPTTNWERHLNKILDFPTKEMRDAFYENFKDLINECKELL